MTKVLVFGTFDLLHPGHRFVFGEAQKRACPNAEGGRGELNIVVARDANVETIKGNPPVQPEHERVEAVKKACPQAQVILGDEKDFLVPVRAVQPDLILLGYDQCLPHGITEDDLRCPVERLPSFEPEKWKSSIQRKERK